VVKGIEHTPLSAVEGKFGNIGLGKSFAHFGEVDEEGAGVVLIGYYQAAHMVEGHRYPGTVFVPVHFVDQVRFESFGNRKTSRFVNNQLRISREIGLAEKKCSGGEYSQGQGTEESLRSVIKHNPRCTEGTHSYKWKFTGSMQFFDQATVT